MDNVEVGSGSGSKLINPISHKKHSVISNDLKSSSFRELNTYLLKTRSNSSVAIVNGEEKLLCFVITDSRFERETTVYTSCSQSQGGTINFPK